MTRLFIFYIFFRLGYWWRCYYIPRGRYSTVIMCTDEENAFINAFTNIQEGDIEDMVEDVVENIEALQESINRVRDRINLHACAQTRRNFRYMHQIEKLDNCMRSNAYDIANIVDKIDELEGEILEISKLTKNFVEECRKVIQDLDADIRKLL